ncbi:MAG: AzlD domain-containing protein [Clostridia bacterium]|nr:AzlD domain-containing protein [Clostridia bacterium]
MSAARLILYIFVMAAVTYLIRMLPTVLFRKTINSVFIRSFLYYIPYAVLAAMTIPWVFYAMQDIWAAVIGFAAAVVMALWGKSLVAVAAVTCAAALAAALML